jgi:hypothetical protein
VAPATRVQGCGAMWSPAAFLFGLLTREIVAKSHISLHPSCGFGPRPLREITDEANYLGFGRLWLGALRCPRHSVIDFDRCPTYKPTLGHDTVSALGQRQAQVVVLDNL